MGVIGSRPAMLVMREAHYGTTRFDDFVERIGAASATTASHLRALTENGLLQRRPYQEAGQRIRDEYVLTEAGLDLMPVIVGLFNWGLRHTDATADLEFSHADCGQPLDLRLECSAGHPLAAGDIELRVSSA